MTVTTLILPGLYDSGPDHWQTLWVRADDTCHRVVQRDWATPRCREWVDTLTEAIAAVPHEVVLVGHSTGSLLVAFWADHAARHAPALLARVRGALLVAPCDPDGPAYPPGPEGFSPVPRAPLPFPSIVVASSTDEYVTLACARAFAESWGSRFVDIGAAGHINGASGFGAWPEGWALLESLHGGEAAARAQASPDRTFVLHWLDAHASPALLGAARTLVREYAAMPHTVGRWHTAEADIAALPHPFLAPAGALLVAYDNATPAGCGALLEFDADAVEMKRVYLRDAYRGRGHGERICRALIARATAMGYRRLLLDTAPELHAARSLYTRLGFVPIPHYRDGLLPDALCYALDLPARHVGAGATER